MTWHCPYCDGENEGALCQFCGRRKEGKGPATESATAGEPWKEVKVWTDPFSQAYHIEFDDGSTCTILPEDLYDLHTVEKVQQRIVELVLERTGKNLEEMNTNAILLGRTRPQEPNSWPKPGAPDSSMVYW
jgi:hypothetical protein